MFFVEMFAGDRVVRVRVFTKHILCFMFTEAWLVRVRVFTIHVLVVRVKAFNNSCTCSSGLPLPLKGGASALPVILFGKSFNEINWNAQYIVIAWS